MAHLCKSALRISLVLIRKISGVTVFSERNPADHALIKLRGVHAPLFDRKVFEKLLINITSALAQYHIFTCPDFIDLYLTALNESFHLILRQIHVIELIDGFQRDGHGDKVSVNIGKHLVLVIMPVTVLADIVKYFLVVCVESMRPVPLNQDTGSIIFIIYVSADVTAFFDHKHLFMKLGCDPLRDRDSGKSGAHYNIFELHRFLSSAISRI